MDDDSDVIVIVNGGKRTVSRVCNRCGQRKPRRAFLNKCGRIRKYCTSCRKTKEHCYRQAYRSLLAPHHIADSAAVSCSRCETLALAEKAEADWRSKHDLL